MLTICLDFLHRISARTARNSLTWLYLLVYSKVQITTYAARLFCLARRSVLRGTLVRGKKGTKKKKKKKKESLKGRRVESLAWKSVPTEGTVDFSSSYSVRFRRRSSASRPRTAPLYFLLSFN